MHYTKFWDSVILQTEVGKVEVKIRTAHVLAWMLRDNNTWLRNSKNHHSTIIPSIQWNQTCPIIISQYITCIYIYTCIVFDFWQDWDIPYYALKMKSQGFNGPSAESFSQRLHSKTFQIKEFAFSIRLSTSISCQARIDLVFYLFPLDQLLLLGKQY